MTSKSDIASNVAFRSQPLRVAHEKFFFIRMFIFNKTTTISYAIPYAIYKS